MKAASPTSASLVDTAQALQRREISPVELVELYRQRIDDGQRLLAFITPPGDSRREARAAERRLKQQRPGRLAGVPIALKDLFATRGIRTTAGSRILRQWVPTVDATVVTRLRGEGAIIFGKTNLHEFAYGVTNANPWWGIARNPRDETRIPGGSSGGSAIAVVAGMAAAALGSDTGGSIRIPAALCGCVGFKPTYGAIPLDGTIPLGWSLDHAGPLTRTVDDAGLLYDVLSDSNAWQAAGSKRASGLRGLRVAILKGTLLRPCEPRMRLAVETAARGLDARGLRVRELEIPELSWTVATQLVTLRAEANAVHTRWFPSQSRAYGRDVRVRLQLGALINGADYVLAQRMRAWIREALRAAFDSFDILMLPTTPISAAPIGERMVRWPRETEPVDGALVRFTAPFNLSGLPALSVPWPQARGLPIGVQLVGRWGDEATVLRVGRLIEDQ